VCKSRFTPAGSTSAALPHRHLDRLRVPPHAWSRRRRLLAASLIALVTFVLGENAWIATDLAAARAMRALRDETQRRFDGAQRAIGELPALRASAGAATSMRPSRATASGASTDDVRIVSQLAARGGITLIALEPGTITGAGIDAVCPLRMTALAQFSQLIAFIRALPSLPVLIVPGELLIRQAKGTSTAGLLSISATLNVFDALRPFDQHAVALQNDAAIDDDEDILFYDPFLQRPQPDARVAGSNTSGFRLVGLLYDLARGLGLVETAEGEAMLEAGQHVGSESVARVDGLGITLASRDGSEHRLTFEEAVR
jgi:Tfp pilus assembly protein PilO